jgi:transcriptional regulator with XRE-family HTH domain
METRTRIIASELRAELGRRRWSRRHLAELVGLSPSFIALICAGLPASERATRLILAALGPEGATRVVDGGQR